MLNCCTQKSYERKDRALIFQLRPKQADYGKGITLYRNRFLMGFNYLAPNSDQKMGGH
jgi:hypothetical protein